MGSKGNSLIRHVWSQEDKRWYFVISDLMKVLSGSDDPFDLIKKQRKADQGLGYVWHALVEQQQLMTKGGLQPFNCVEMGGAIIIMKTMRQRKLESFRQWLNNLDFEEYATNRSFEFKAGDLMRFMSLLNHVGNWKKRWEAAKKKYQSSPSMYERMNDLELLLVSLEEGDLR